MTDAGRLARLRDLVFRRDAGKDAREGRGIVVEVSDRIPEGLLYARGFLLSPRGQAVPPSVVHWTLVGLGDHEIRIDPRVPVQQAKQGTREAILIGDAFDPEHDIYVDAAGYLLEGNLLNRLDHMAGRFVLIVKTSDGKIEIYHDAMGSRSVFYSDSGVVASHAGLVADVIGSGLREWVIPFITSKGFINRDVKYLPGLESPFDRVVQLTPNTRLVLPSVSVERYWPREGCVPSGEHEAFSALDRHLSGLNAYLKANGISPILGLSAGRDSRGVLAGLSDLRPQLFTFVRSSTGKSEASADSKTAGRLSAALGLELEIVKILAPAPLDQSGSGFAKAYRRNTGYVRGGGSVAWIEHFHGRDRPNQVFVRGFGGEVMRGFYPEIGEATPGKLANTYGVNASSQYTLNAFDAFMRRSGWLAHPLYNFRRDDLFYWEHRMGVWGASALAESDMAFRTMPGYNSRALFSVFMGLPEKLRNTSSIFEKVTLFKVPEFEGIPYDS